MRVQWKAQPPEDNCVDRLALRHNVRGYVLIGGGMGTAEMIYLF